MHLRSVAVLTALLLSALPASAGTITTIAGTGGVGSGGDGGLATDATFDVLNGVAHDLDGNLYILDALRVRRVDASTGVITTVAGTGDLGLPADGPASSAEFLELSGIATDTDGNVYVSDAESSVVLKIDVLNDTLTVVAGIVGMEGYSGDGGPATSATLFAPEGLAVDTAGNLFIADVRNGLIRQVDTAGIIDIYAGVFGGRGCSGDGGPADAASLDRPQKVAVDSLNTLYLSTGCQDGAVVKRVDPDTRIIDTVAGGGVATTGSGDPFDFQLTPIDGLATDLADNLDISSGLVVRRLDFGTSTLEPVAGDGTPGFSGDGGDALDAQLLGANGLSVNPLTDTLAISDSGNHRIRSVDFTPPPPPDFTVDDSTTQAELDALTEVLGDFEMVGTTQDDLVLPSLLTVGGDFVVDENGSLLLVDADTLTSVGGALTISENGQLAALDLTSLSSTGGSLSIVDNGSREYGVRLPPRG